MCRIAITKMTAHCRYSLLPSTHCYINKRCTSVSGIGEVWGSYAGDMEDCGLLPCSSVDRCEPFGRTCCRWRGSSLWEGPAVGGEVRAFGKELPSMDRCEPLGRTYCRWTGASLWEGPAVSSIIVEDSYTFSETLSPVQYSTRHLISPASRTIMLNRSDVVRTPDKSTVTATDQRRL